MRFRRELRDTEWHLNRAHTWQRRFAWLPTRINRQWVIWLEKYEVRYPDAETRRASHTWNYVHYGAPERRIPPETNKEKNNE